MNVLIFMDGVLRGGFGQPLKPGVALFLSMAQKNRVMLVGSDQEADKRWLEEEHLTDYSSLTVLDPLDAEAEIIWRTLSTVRSRGRIDLVILANPEQAAECYTLGYDVMLYVSPRFARPSWRPDIAKTGPTPWAAFTEEIRAQRRAAAAIPPVPDE